MCLQDSLVEQITQSLFVPYVRNYILTTTIGRLEHLGPVCATAGLRGLRDYSDPS